MFYYFSDYIFLVFTIFQRTTAMKPRLRLTCGDCWTWWPARPGSPSPNDPPLTRTPSPRRTAVGLRPGPRALHLRPMPEMAVRLHRISNRPFRRSPRASGWSPFIRRQSSPTSMSSSLSLTSPLQFSVGPLFFIHFSIISFTKFTLTYCLGPIMHCLRKFNASLNRDITVSVHTLHDNCFHAENMGKYSIFRIDFSSSNLMVL